MALRGKKPEERDKRLRLLLSGEAGVGKTTAAIQMPKPYIIDTEQGSVHYGDAIEAAGGAVFEARQFDDIITEVRSLMTTDHDYLTLVIDPITVVFNETLDEGERKVGTEFGRHYGHANKLFKRLCSLITSIDMNVVITAHAKNEYGEDMKVIGKTFDGYKKLDYIFDLWLELERDRKTKKRMATVRKTRLVEFPDGDQFEFTRDNLLERYGDGMQKKAASVALASPEQVERFNYLMGTLTEEEIKALKIDKAMKGVESVADMPAERIAKGIEIMEAHKSASRVAA